MVRKNDSDGAVAGGLAGGLARGMELETNGAALVKALQPMAGRHRLRSEAGT